MDTISPTALVGDAIDPRTMTLTEAIDYYRKLPGGAQWRSNNVRAIRDTSLGSLKLPYVTRGAIRRWCDQRLEAVRATTVRNELALIRRAVETVRIELGLVMAANPAVGITLIDKDRRLSAEELSRLCRALERWPVIWALVVVATETELTRGDLLTMRWQDVHLDQAVAHLRRTRDGVITRSVPLSPIAINALRRLQRPSMWVFPIAVERLRLTWASACRRACVKGVWFHEVRHVLRR